MSFFVAVDLDGPVRAQVAELIAQREHLVPAKWLRADKLHVTLQYLAHPAPFALAALQPKLAEVAARHAPFRLQLEGAGLFETGRAPAVLWLGVRGETRALEALQRDVAAAAGLPFDKPFVPHVTLARGKSRPALGALCEALASFASPAFTVGGLTLYESNNHVHRRVFEAPLGPGNPR